MKCKNTSLLLTFIFIFCLSFNVLADNSTALPEIYGKAAITVDMQTNEIIYEKNADIKMYPASTTKLLTAILLEKNKKPGDMLTYTADAKSQPPSSLNRDLHAIEVGDTMSAEDVMDGLLMYSANDLAYVVAENVSKDAPTFSDKMNEEVKNLNLKNTHFVTPNGLHNPNHYTTPYDMSVIARQAFKIPRIQKAMERPANTIKTTKGLAFPIKNTNKLLGKDGCIAGKTGYTDPAGRCLVAIYNRNGREMVGVVMGSVYDPADSYVFNDMEKIINWSYSKQPVVLNKKDSIIGRKEVSYNPISFIGIKKSLEVPIKIKDDVTYYDNDLNKKDLKEIISIKNTSVEALKGEVPLGTLTVNQREFSKDYNIYSDLPKQTLDKNVISFYAAIFILALIFIFILARIMKRRKRRHRYL
ncbi:D-alanyl-D-alanine carboxypeptidase family protein [Clostridium coskatii]|uniref:D-alanyl-D-alanine carboxypeptidase DacB n=1 Tax=Clostridium coskatii TaxID=1705578 RepID=A0A166U139_9CLOT|nr:D-alanyl-D-alanine carboxypeptidase family protein [Clostridium coskatii]OAA94430.1 D-alanyl-D-alanine carboxypeptidase DacB precursor [Clostridium coskatii]OBR93174.1 D-alanyl-D-alanine carboxypeptidase DacB precursor [Clostridium coskatii]